MATWQHHNMATQKGRVKGQSHFLPPPRLLKAFKSRELQIHRTLRSGGVKSKETTFLNVSRTDLSILILFSTREIIFLVLNSRVKLLKDHDFHKNSAFEDF